MMRRVIDASAERPRVGFTTAVEPRPWIRSPALSERAEYFYRCDRCGAELPGPSALADDANAFAALHSLCEEPASRRTPMQDTFELIAIKDLHESPHNPRKRFDETAMTELTVSVKVKGVMTPLLVRLRSRGGYEIGAGHRRYRAAKAAGLDQVPCVVRDLSDEDFLELVVFENDEREDVHPLEEAHGYQTLMRELKRDVAQVAARAGKSEKYVYDRVKLLQLIPEAQKLFLANRMSAGHAILLARLTPKDQARAIAVNGGGLFTDESVAIVDEYDDGEYLKAVSVRELESWIDAHVRLRPAVDVKPILYPATAAALAEAAKVIPITHNHYVRPEAREGRTWGPQSWKRADGKHGSKTCPLAVTGLVVVGPERGQAFRICVDKEKCATHWGAEKRERARRRARGEVGGGGGGRAETPDARASREAEAAYEEQLQEEVDRRYLRAMLAKVKWPLARADAELLLTTAMNDYVFEENEETLCGAAWLKDEGAAAAAVKSHKPSRLSNDELLRLLIGHAIWTTREHYLGGKRTQEIEKQRGVNRAAIEKLVAKEMPRPEKPKKKPVQTSARRRRAA
jgi:ParB/RepB/Spo0J family partition protein